MDLGGKVIVVTGAGRGLGRCMAESVSKKGAKVALIARNTEQLEESAEICRKAGSPDARVYSVNVADEQAVDQAFDSIASDLGRIDGLVNNAGVTRDGLLLKVKDGKVVKTMSMEQWQTVIDINLTGVFLCGRAAARHMVEQGDGGCIVNIASVVRSGNMGQSNYSATKAGVESLTVTWAKELARYKVRVGGVSPGYCATEMVTSIGDEVLDKIKGGIPLKRLAEPEEIAHAVCFVFENDYLTGRLVEIDGGLRI